MEAKEGRSFVPENYGDVLRYDDAPIPDLEDVKLSASPMAELGATGLKRATGVIDEEFLPALRGRKAIKVYREMSLNDPMVGAMMFAIDKLIRQVHWRVESSDTTPESTKAADFLESCMDDMSHTWNDMISEILSMLVYGFSWHEIVYKKRVGPWEKDPTRKSKYDDGLIGWRKIPIRSQETMLRWVFDDEGGVQGMVQIAPPLYKTAVLPINKSLLFRTGLYKGNPEGQSVLRTAYRPWFFKKRLEEFEAIGVERDLAGLPVAKVPSSYMKARQDTPEYKVYQAFKKMVQNVRRDEHEGLVLPQEYDQDTKQPLFEFELMSSGGSRTFDTNALIQRYEQRILMSTLADFILLGHEGTGSYAMHVDKTGIFRAALNVITDAIADTFNRHAIPRLFELNAWKLKELPKLVPNNVDPPDLSQLAQFMTSMGGLGMQFFPDPELEKFLRETAHLPEIPDELLEQRRQMALQNNAMQFAQSQMDFMGTHQKAEAVQQGMTPEQAEQAAQAPTPEMQEQEAVGGAVAQAHAQAHPDVQAAQQQQMEQEQAASAGAAGDPVGEKVATTQVEEAKAQADHKRSLEMKDREDKSSKEGDSRKMAMEKLKAKMAAKKDAKKPAPKGKR
jgi:hypothetical protein